MVACLVQIIEIVDDSFYPGICKAVLTDCSGQKHIILDKPPVFGFEIETIDQLPFTASVSCELIDDLGDRVKIDTDIPDHVESEEECHVFVVPRSSIVESCVN